MKENCRLCHGTKYIGFFKNASEEQIELEECPNCLGYGFFLTDEQRIAIVKARGKLEIMKIEYDLKDSEDAILERNLIG